MEKDPFVQVEPSSELLEIAESRLPESSAVFNMILMAIKSKEINQQMQFFITENTVTSSTWILAMAKTEDYGMQICLSIPSEDEKDETRIIQVFNNTKVIPWKEKFVFCFLAQPLSGIFLKLTINILGLAVTVRPSKVFTMDRKSAKEIGINMPNPNITIKPLNSEAGIEFVTKNWHHRLEGSEKVIRRVLENLPSVGIFNNHKELLASAALHVNGYYGYVYTSKSARGQGYGRLVELSLMKQLGEEGYVPFCTAEIQNHRSVKMHERIHKHLTFLHVINYIVHMPDLFDD